MIAQEKRVEDEEPQGSNGDDEGGEAGRNRKLRVRQREVTAHQQEQADNCGARDLLGGVKDSAAGEGADCQHNDPSDRKAKPTHQCGRNGLHRDVDGKVGRSPEEIDESESKDYHPPAWARNRVHCREKAKGR